MKRLALLLALCAVSVASVYVGTHLPLTEMGKAVQVADAALADRSDGPFSFDRGWKLTTVKNNTRFKLIYRHGPKALQVFVQDGAAIIIGAP